MTDFICQCVAQAFELIDDELSKKYSEMGCHVERRDSRTVLTTFGALTITRRRMKKDGEDGFYPLDREFGFKKYQRYTPYFEYIIATLGAKMVYRTVSYAVETLTPVAVSHQQVSNIIKSSGEHYEKWEKRDMNKIPNKKYELKSPEVLYIEGDGLVIGGRGRKKTEIHRFQIAEGVKKCGKRSELSGTHYVADFSAKTAKEQMENYLADNYDLTKTIVISNSDGGIGYSKEAFQDMIGKTLRHEHFRDKYHVNRKCKERLS